MAATTVPALRLNNDVEMPALGLGVFQSPPEETVAAVETALRDGYRHIDTAAAYGNEREVGDAVRASTMKLLTPMARTLPSPSSVSRAR